MRRHLEDDEMGGITLYSPWPEENLFPSCGKGERTLRAEDAMREDIVVGGMWGKCGVKDGNEGCRKKIDP